MSTVTRILELEEGGCLVRFRPTFRGREHERRKLSVEPSIHAWLYENVLDDGEQDIRAQARANCGTFVKGHLINDLDFMKRVEDRRSRNNDFNHGVWALSVRFNPQLRLFGVFAIVDWFIILSKQKRDVLHLGDEKWHEQIGLCLSRFKTLFPGRDVWVKDNISEYLSFNVEKQDGRW
jgi:hypothetical protein